MAKLGVNVDHVATLRQARGGEDPSLPQAIMEVELGGADGITAHLREDRRHIQDRDLMAIRNATKLPVNLEMALVAEIVKIALKFQPEKVCIVPEKRLEVTTEGGLDVIKKRRLLEDVIPKLQAKKIQVSLFIDPIIKQIETAAALGANAIEIHTGSYANTKGDAREKEFDRIRKAAGAAKKLGLIVHAGHGLNYQNVKALLKITEIEEYNIGHSIVSYSVFVGLQKAVAEMKRILSSN